MYLVKNSKTLCNHYTRDNTTHLSFRRTVGQWVLFLIGKYSPVGAEFWYEWLVWNGWMKCFSEKNTNDCCLDVSWSCSEVTRFLVVGLGGPSSKCNVGCLNKYIWSNSWLSVSYNIKITVRIPANYERFCSFCY